jgi:hypothetical protein
MLNLGLSTYTLVKEKKSISVKFTAMTILSITNLYHEINQILNTKYFVVGERVLLVNSFNKKPKFIDNLHIVRVDPVIAAHHQTVKELLLKFLRFPDLKSYICQVLNCLTVYTARRKFTYHIE